MKGATTLLTFLFRVAEPAACDAFFSRVSELEAQDRDATLARSVMATTFVAHAFRNAELEKRVFGHWGDDAGSWSGYMRGSARERWFSSSREGEYEGVQVNDWATMYKVPEGLCRAVHGLVDSVQGGGDDVDLVMDAASRWTGGVRAMYAWVARGLCGRGPRRWDASVKVLKELLVLSTYMGGLSDFEREVNDLTPTRKRAAVRSLMRVVKVQEAPRRVDTVVRQELASYFGPMGRWQGYLTLDLKQAALAIFSTQHD